MTTKTMTLKDEHKALVREIGASQGEETFTLDMFVSGKLPSASGRKKTFQALVKGGYIAEVTPGVFTLSDVANVWLARDADEKTQAERDANLCLGCGANLPEGHASPACDTCNAELDEAERTEPLAIDLVVELASEDVAIDEPVAPKIPTIRGEPRYLLTINDPQVESYLGFGAHVVQTHGNVFIIAVGTADADWQMQRLQSGGKTISYTQFADLEVAVCFLEERAKLLGMVNTFAERAPEEPATEEPTEIEPDLPKLVYLLAKTGANSRLWGSSAVVMSQIGGYVVLETGEYIAPAITKRLREAKMLGSETIFEILEAAIDAAEERCKVQPAAAKAAKTRKSPKAPVAKATTAPAPGGKRVMECKLHDIPGLYKERTVKNVVEARVYYAPQAVAEHPEWAAFGTDWVTTCETHGTHQRYHTLATALAKMSCKEVCAA